MHGVACHERTSSRSAAKLRGRRFSATMPRVFRFPAGLLELPRLSFFRLFGPLLHIAAGHGGSRWHMVFGFAVSGELFPAKTR